MVKNDWGRKTALTFIQDQIALLAPKVIVTHVDDETAPVDEDLDAEADEAETERWTNYDLSRDWREDGPFDFEEVDLEADERIPSAPAAR